ncbi:hypothetical protein [Nocardioides ferulae]|uniref:hypothetical protein n=1 Tax=Nocardioides ferulae TaxID=2340821 RepID=UPI000EB4ADA7|nr:hypothetical protein [Nocardioides ferulae]
MSLLLGQPAMPTADLPPADEPTASGRPGRSRWPRWTAVVAALGLAWALAPQGVRLGQDVRVAMPVRAGLEVPEYGADGTYFLAYEYGETVTVGVPVSNTGLLPVTVTGVRLVEPEFPLLEPVPEGEGAAEPVELGPFEEAVVPLTFRFANCRYYHERATQSYTAAEVTGSVLGRSFTETVSFAEPLTSHAQVILDCPERTLVRGDDRRLPAPGRG